MFKKKWIYIGVTCLLLGYPVLQMHSAMLTVRAIWNRIYDETTHKIKLTANSQANSRFYTVEEILNDVYDDTNRKLNTDAGASGIITETASTGTVAPGLVYTGAAHTALTASTERFDVQWNSARTVQWATGALALERFHVFQAPTIAFVGASTVTDVATVAISGAPIKGTNATVTNTHGLLIQSGDVSTAIASYGLTVNAPTGATNNYSAQFNGGRVIINSANTNNKDIQLFDSNGQEILSIRANGQLNMRNPASNSYQEIVVLNSANDAATHSFNFGYTSTSYAGFGGFTGEFGYLGVNGNFPFGLFTNAIFRIKILGNGDTQFLGSKMGFFSAAVVAQQASGADLTNNVTSGGTTDTIANYTDLVTYANDAAAIRNDIYQLARKLKQVNDALRLYGLLN